MKMNWFGECGVCSGRLPSALGMPVLLSITPEPAMRFTSAKNGRRFDGGFCESQSRLAAPVPLTSYALLVGDEQRPNSTLGEERKSLRFFAAGPNDPSMALVRAPARRRMVFETQSRLAALVSKCTYFGDAERCRARRSRSAAFFPAKRSHCSRPDLQLLLQPSEEVRKSGLRYTWIRDAAFTITVSSAWPDRSGDASKKWAQRSLARAGDRNDFLCKRFMRLMSQYCGNDSRSLGGIPGSRPVRIGNAARQKLPAYDIYGES